MKQYTQLYDVNDLIIHDKQMLGYFKVCYTQHAIKKNKKTYNFITAF